MAEKKPLNIWKIGLSLESYGGVANQQRCLIAHMPREEAEIEHISTILAQVHVGRASNAVRFVGAWARVLVRLLTSSPDVIHMHTSQRGSVWRKVLICPLAWMRGVPVILHAHGSEFHLFYRGLGRWSRAILTAALRRCDGLIVLSESWKRFYVDEVGLDAQQVVVMPNPVEIPETVPDRRGRERILIVFLGRVGARKGAFELIRAFASLPETVRERAKLVLGGDGETEQAEQLAAELDCADRVEVRGWLDDDHRNTLLREADVFVLPTHNEGMPLALLEAMSWGVASISTPVGGIPEVLEHEANGLLIEPGEVEQLRDALNRLIDDEPLRLTLGAAGRRTAERLDVHVYVRRLMELYRCLADRKTLTHWSTPAIEDSES